MLFAYGSSSGAFPQARTARPGAAALFTDSPNARSKTITVADGPHTHGVLNQHSSSPSAYSIGVYSETGPRRTMEDSHSFVVDFANVKGQGYFAIFDGHAGKHAAEWCGAHFHEYLLDSLDAAPHSAIPEVLNTAFARVDGELSKLAEEGKTHSGCTAVTAFLRLEDQNGRQLFLDATPSETTTAVEEDPSASPPPAEADSKLARMKNAMKNLAGRKSGDGLGEEKEPPIVPPQGLRKVLYTANAGDARAVLCRKGQGVRLTYDHKGSDQQEARRIKEAGGFVMNNRVNGVLAVTRSLGDASMKEFVTGAPFTTETELADGDEFLIIACDGLWDVIEDTAAVELVREITDPQAAAKFLVRHALDHFSNDNITVLVVRFHDTHLAGIPPTK